MSRSVHALRRKCNLQCRIREGRSLRRRLFVSPGSPRLTELYFSCDNRRPREQGAGREEEPPALCSWDGQHLRWSPDAARVVSVPTIIRPPWFRPELVRFRTKSLIAETS